MGEINNMVGIGFPPEMAKSIVGPVNVAQTSAGSSQTDATAITGDAVLLPTVGSGTGVIISASMSVGSEIRIYNGGANALAVYPPTGGQINDGTANAAISITAARGAIITRLSATHFGAVYS